MPEALQRKKTERLRPDARPLPSNLRHQLVKLLLSEFLLASQESLIAAVMIVSFILPIVSFAPPIKLAGVSRAASQLSRKTTGCTLRWRISGVLAVGGRKDDAFVFGDATRATTNSENHPILIPSKLELGQYVGSVRVCI